MKNAKISRQIITVLLFAAGLLLCVLNFAEITDIAAAFADIILPLILGLVLAYILNILVVKFEKIYFPNSKNRFIKVTRKPAGIILSILTVVLIILLVIYIVVPQVITALVTIASEIPDIIDGLYAWADQHRDEIPIIAEQLQKIDIDWSNISQTIGGYAINGVGGLLTSTFGFASGVVSGLFTLFMTVSFAVYLLAGKETLLEQVKRVQKAFLKESHLENLNHGFAVANDSFSSYIAGQCLEALILGTLCALGMWIFQFPFAATVGVFVGATALIPIVGAYLGAGVGALLILTVDPLKALLFIIYIVVLQQLETNLIFPKVVGKSVGLPGIWIVASVVIFGGLFGIAGMIIGVPFTATAYKLLQTAVRKKLNS